MILRQDRGLSGELDLFLNIFKTWAVKVCFHGCTFWVWTDLLSPTKSLDLIFWFVYHSFLVLAGYVAWWESVKIASLFSVWFIDLSGPCYRQPLVTFLTCFFTWLAPAYFSQTLSQYSVAQHTLFMRAHLFIKGKCTGWHSCQWNVWLEALHLHWLLLYWSQRMKKATTARVDHSVCETN